MRRKFVFAVLAACVTTQAEGHTRPDKEQCRKVKEEIRKIHSRMRAGYGARTGIRLAARLRELQQQRARACR